MYIDNYGRIIHAGASEGMKYGVPQLNKFPLPDARHVKSAIKFFNYVPPKYEKQLASAIIRRMKEYGLSFDDFTVGEENRFKKYVPDTYLAHHGILGQKWGRKNGPPYPLSAGKHSAAEKKAGWRKSLAEGAGKAARLTGKGLAKAGSWTVDKIVMWKRFPNRLLSDKTLERKRERYALENDVIRSTGRMPRDQKLAARLERGKYRREVAKQVLGETLKVIGSQAFGTYLKKKVENKAELKLNSKRKDLDFEANVRGDIYKDARAEGLSAEAAAKLARAGKEVLRTDDPYRGLDASVKKKAQETAFDKATKAGKSIDEALKFTREGGAEHKDPIESAKRPQAESKSSTPLADSVRLFDTVKPGPSTSSNYDVGPEDKNAPKTISFTKFNPSSLLGDDTRKQYGRSLADTTRLSETVKTGSIPTDSYKYDTGPQAKNAPKTTSFTKLDLESLLGVSKSSQSASRHAKEQKAFKAFRKAKMADIKKSGTGARISGNYVIYSDGSRKSLKELFDSQIDFWMGTY